MNIPQGRIKQYWHASFTAIKISVVKLTHVSGKTRDINEAGWSSAGN